MIASNGEVEVVDLEDGMDGESEVRSDADPRRSAAAPTMPVEED